jgi:hypothetical protein
VLLALVVTGDAKGGEMKVAAMIPAAMPPQVAVQAPAVPTQPAVPAPTAPPARATQAPAATPQAMLSTRSKRAVANKKKHRRASAKAHRAAKRGKRVAAVKRDPLLDLLR